MGILDILSIKGVGRVVEKEDIKWEARGSNLEPEWLGRHTRCAGVMHVLCLCDSKHVYRNTIAGSPLHSQKLNFSIFMF
jgi:hypothetical protein